MKAFWKEFLLRGLICAGGGPLVLAVIYGILGATGTVAAITPGEVCMAILTITVLAFVVAGMTAIYQIEQLPLPNAILIHGGVLYLIYILIYLVNGWLVNQLTSILVFTGIFLAGYALIWLVIYAIHKKKAAKVNRLLKEN